MGGLIKRILRYLFSQSKEAYVEIHRNELCYCNSGRKYKHCHKPLLEKKGKMALYSNYAGHRKLKIISEMEYKNMGVHIKTSLTGNDIGGRLD